MQYPGCNLNISRETRNWCQFPTASQDPAEPEGSAGVEAKLQASHTRPTALLSQRKDFLPLSLLPHFNQHGINLACCIPPSGLSLGGQAAFLFTSYKELVLRPTNLARARPSSPPQAELAHSQQCHTVLGAYCCQLERSLSRTRWLGQKCIPPSRRLATAKFS